MVYFSGKDGEKGWVWRVSVVYFKLVYYGVKYPQTDKERRL